MGKIDQTSRRRLVFAGRCALVVMAGAVAGYGHDAITTKITFDREIVRLMVSHCGTCHRDGGTAFSLMTYEAARPWAKAIGEEVLQRRMPPWGAVKGFGDFRNDKGLTEEQLELIVDWEEGGAPEGDPKDIPTDIKFPVDAAAPHYSQEVAVSGDTKLSKPLVLDAISPKLIPDSATYQVIAELPDGDIQPLIWFQNYKKAFEHPFLLRNPLELPAGTVIHGVPASDTIALLPAPKALTEHLSGQLRKPPVPGK
ncbi:MAG TPA: cytochrome c [Bryobacteraceae bacterium]|jgi:hypothetical protein|nr:cytochrome c [Bryobacteraceae bacterium]